LKFSALSFTGSSLECYACVKECQSPTKMACSAGNRCFTLSAKHENFNFDAKSCIPAALCNQPYGSLPPGFPSLKPSCCDSNLCNSAVTNMMSLGTAVLLPLVSLYISQF
ncbi:hypothetical protein AB205_0164780, partial [Aquarana catesbeiana]